MNQQPALYKSAALPLSYEALKLDSQDEIASSLPSCNGRERTTVILLAKLVHQEVVATSRIVRLRAGGPSTVASDAFEIFSSLSNSSSVKLLR